MAKLDFEEIVALYDKRLLNVMYAMTGNYHDALDLTEEAFLAAMRAYPRFRGDADPFTWLYRIAVNLLRKSYRKRARREELLREQEGHEPTPVAETRTAADALIEDERARAVRAAIAELAPQFREAITLRYIDEMSYEEIAAAAGCSIGTVKSRISRGKSLLADLLEGEV